jgi:hypothetical protein
MHLQQIINTQEIKDFFEEHKNADTSRLALQAQKYSHLPFKELLVQIQARQKMRLKLPEWISYSDLIFPPQLSLEQASSELTARYKAGILAALSGQPESILDITGGMGVDTYYMAAFFSRVFYIEQNEALVQLARYNFDLLGQRHIETIHSDAATFLSSFEGTCSCIYLDPARRDQHNRKLIRLADCSPSIVELLPDMLRLSPLICLKASPILDIDAALNELSDGFQGKAHVADVHIISSAGECKEVLYMISAGLADEAPLVHAVDVLQADLVREFSFRHKIQPEPLWASEPAQFLYEPNPSLMKSGGFGALSQATGLGKLHPHSHLFTSEHLYNNFPGRSFRILACVKPSASALRPLMPQPKANITVRNYPESVAQIRQKTGIKEGGELYLFFTTLLSGQKVAIVCEKLS